MENVSRQRTCVKSTYTTLVADTVGTAVLTACITCIQARNIAWVRCNMSSTRVSFEDVELVATDTASVDVSLH